MEKKDDYADYKFIDSLKELLDLKKFIKLLDNKNNPKKELEIIHYILVSCSKNKTDLKKLQKNIDLIHSQFYDGLLAEISDNFKVVNSKTTIVNDDVFDIFYSFNIYSSKINKKFYIVLEKNLMGGDYNELYCINSFKDKKLANKSMALELTKIKKNK
jgi:hypothetical protein